MRFYNYELSFAENMHNNARVLFVLGVIIIIFVIVNLLTSKTEEKKAEAKFMFNIGFTTGIAAVVLSLIMFFTTK